MRKYAGLLLLLTLGLSAAPPAREPQTDARLKKSFRRPDNNGWIQVHLEGSPAEIGFQHGYWLATEIQDTFRVIQLGLTHDSKKDWAFFRGAAEKLLWLHIEPQYRDELKGIVEGLKSRGAKVDQWDLVAMNAW